MSEKYEFTEIVISWFGGMASALIILCVIMPMLGYTEISTDFLDSVCKDKLGIDNVEYSGTSGTNIYCKEIIPTIENAKQLDGTDSYVILEGRK